MELNSLDWPEISKRLGGFATSQVAKDRLLSIRPLTDAEAAKKSFAEIGDAVATLKLGHRPFMESLDLYSIWHQRLVKGAVLKTMELKDVRHFCIEVIALSEILNAAQGAWVKAIERDLMNSTEPLSAIDQIMTPEGDIRTDASERLFQLYREKNQTIRQAQSLLDRLVKQHDMEPVLQDRYVTNREGRWVLPVRSGKQHDFEGIIHASSQSKQTVFMEPKEIIPLNNRLRQIEVDIEEEVERLLQQLSDYLKFRQEAFEITYDRMLECDLRFAQAQLATHMSAGPCEFSDSEINLVDLKHPLLILNNEDVIPNTVHLNKDHRILLLSGPNAGGKTVLLKAVGLAVHMARCGLLISAEEGSKLPFCKKMYVAVGDSQSVDQRLSTFAAHLKVLNESTEARGFDTLLLIDEICGSTDPEEGTALARAFIESYAGNDTFGVITSHLGPLKLGWNENSGVVNGSLEYDSKSGQPTYQFLMGIPGQSLALQTARRVGVQDRIIERAMECLNPNMKEYHLGLEEVERMKEELHHLKDEMNQQTKESRQAKSKYQNLIEKFERDREKMLEQSMKRAEKKIDTLIENSKVDDVFKKYERLEKIKSDLPEVVKASTVKNSSSSNTRIETPEDFARAFPPGSKVFAPTIGRDGVVQGIPNSKGEVPILSHSMRLVVPWDQLRPPQAASNPTIDMLRKVGEVSNMEVERSVDLRGHSVEEALRELDAQMDNAAVKQEERVKVIHGHGTDALKKAVRAYLSRSIYVKKWKAGTPESGGDGVTWVEIKD